MVNKGESTSENVKTVTKRDRNAISSNSFVSSPPPSPAPKPKKQKDSKSRSSDDHKTRRDQDESVKKHDSPKESRQSKAKNAKEGASSPNGSKAEININGLDTKSPSSKKRRKVFSPPPENLAGSTTGSPVLKRQRKGIVVQSQVESAVADSKRKRKHDQLQKEGDIVEERPTTKHAKIMSKFEKSIKAARTVEENDHQPEKDANENQNAVVAHGLEPLPQPAPAPDHDEKPTYSTVPDWIANPVTGPMSEDEPRKFDTMKVKLVGRLRKHGYVEASAVQAAVIPLLLRQPGSHPGDLCVSASTGSGKTLAYVVPLVESLERYAVAKFRAVIVVPTRELVKQVRGTFDICGGGLRIGTAVGNVALKEEQQKLMRLDSVYEPEAYRQRQEQIMTTKDWTEFNLLDYKDEVDALRDSQYGYVNRPQPNVDVLICTPGRLVDHLRFTKGFSLRNVEYLVLDEADRLLNESFQEWVEVVMKSLDERKSPDASGRASQVLANIGLPLQIKEPKKIILSATLTKDLAKLNSLRLHNPKLVAIGSQPKNASDSSMAGTESEKFVLPKTLKEHSISVKDGSQKPLELLLLLQNKIFNNGTSKETDVNEGRVHDHISDSSDDGSESDSDETSSSGSDSDSDSDSSSESGSETSSDESSESESDDGSVQRDAGRTKHASISTTLVFTKSSESAARLSRLLQLMCPPLQSQLGTIIKSNKSSSSRKTLRGYRAGRIAVIVATDRASRGLDLADLRHVVNYDMPTSVTTYVHRVGRTARAGRSGDAWTFVEHREGRWFAKEIAAAGVNGKLLREDTDDGAVVRKFDLKPPTQEMTRNYETALESLAAEVNRN
jgi:ATP-dependent RNA helicase DDX51/DBP6